MSEPTRSPVSAAADADTYRPYLIEPQSQARGSERGTNDPDLERA